MDYTPLPHIPRRDGAFTQIQPFTYRDGETYLNELMRLRKYVEALAELIDASQQELYDSVLDDINASIDSVNDALSEQVDQVNAEISTLVTYVNDSVQSIINNSIEVQDPVVAALIGTPGSETHTQLDATAVMLHPSKTALSADAQAAVEAARDLVMEGGRIDYGAGTGDRIAPDVITLPPGKITITELGALMAEVSPDSRRSRGVLIQGASRYATEIVFDPPTAGYLIENLDRASHITIRDVTFTGASNLAGFMHSDGEGGPQNMVFERVVWRGTWDKVFNLTGFECNSEFVFMACTLIGSVGTFLHSTNDQALNHIFIGCNFEQDTGDVFNYQAGGHLSVIGGSWIGSKRAEGSGTFITLGAQTIYGTNRLLVEGVRVEYRNPNWKLIDSQWSRGTITFRDFHDNGYGVDLENQGNYVRATFSHANYDAAQWPIIVFDQCRLVGKHEYKAKGQTDAYRQSILYSNCTIQNHTSMREFIVDILDPAISTRLGAVAPVEFRGCVLPAVAPMMGSATDQVLNWERMRHGFPGKRVVSMKTSSSILPYSGAPAVEVQIPLNAIITKITCLAAPGSSSSASTSWGWKLETAETVPTVLFDKGAADAGGAAENAGWLLETEPWFQTRSEDARTLRLTATPTGTFDSGQASAFLVEYLA